MLRVSALGVALLVIACGGDTPTQPTPVVQPPTPPATVANIAGIWTGSMQFTFTARGSVGVSMTLVQDSEARVTGTWRVTSTGNDIHGDVAGTLTGIGVDTRITGTMTYNGETADRVGRCLGRSTIDGPASPPSMRWTSATGFTFDTCTGTFSDLVLTWTR